jgi:hypothetical protein
LPSVIGGREFDVNDNFEKNTNYGTWNFIAKYVRLPIKAIFSMIRSSGGSSDPRREVATVRPPIVARIDGGPEDPDRAPAGARRCGAVRTASRRRAPEAFSRLRRGNRRPAD